MRWLGFALMAIGFVLLWYRVWKLEQSVQTLASIADLSFKSMQILDERQKVAEAVLHLDGQSVDSWVSQSTAKYTTNGLES